MPAPPIAHPPDAVLGQFVLGKLADTHDEQVTEHLAGCTRCQVRAAGIHPDDTLASLIAAVGTKIECGATVGPTADATPPAGPVDATHTFVSPTPSGAPAGLSGHLRYRLVRQLGEGGMGVVWLAEHALMRRPVALKVIHPAHLTRPGAVERFRREVRAAAKLNHPNIVTAFDADEVGGTHFLVMEYVPGETLLEVVRRGPLPVGEACRAISDAACGLAHAHAAGLVHRDIKPGNLVRSPDGVVKVLDFGLVAAGGGEGLTGESVSMGTPDYIAPEQAVDASAADARSDIYALGCTLYHLLAGRVPYPNRTAMQKLDAHRDPAARPAPIPGLPDGLAAVLVRMTATDPAARFPTAAAIADALAPFCEGTAPAARLARWRWVRVAAGLAFLVTAAVALGAVYTSRVGNEVVTVETDDPDIEVVMRKNGELIRVVDTKTKKTWELDAKNMRLAADGAELTVDLTDKGPLVLRRNGAAVVTIRRGPVAAPATPAGSADVVELHRIPFNFAVGHDFSADGSEFLAYAASAGKRVCVIFDAKTGKETGRLPLPAGTALYTWFIPGSRDLLMSVDLKVGRYDRATGAKRADLLEIPAACMVAPLSPAGDRMAIQVMDGAGPGLHRVVVFDLRTGAVRFKVDPVHNTSILGMSPRFSLDGKRLVTTDTTATASAIRVWDAADGKLLKTIDVAGALTAVAEFVGAGPDVVAAYSPNGATTSVGRWDTDTGERRGTARLTFAKGDGGSNFQPGGRVAGVSAEGGAALRFHSLDTGDPIAVYRPAGGVRSWVASADGRFALVVTDADLRVIRVPSPR